MTNKLLSEEELKTRLIHLTDGQLSTYEHKTEVYKSLIDLVESQKKAFAEMIIDMDTDVDIPEALKKIYNEGYSKGYNDRTYENSYNSVDFRMAEAIAPAVAKVRSRYDKQLKALEEA